MGCVWCELASSVQMSCMGRHGEKGNLVQPKQLTSKGGLNERTNEHEIPNKDSQRRNVVETESLEAHETAGINRAANHIKAQGTNEGICMDAIQDPKSSSVWL